MDLEQSGSGFANPLKKVNVILSDLKDFVTESLYFSVKNPSKDSTLTSLIIELLSLS